MRLPNPWIAIPSLAGGAAAGVVGWIVTELSCHPGLNLDQGEGCPATAGAVAGVAFVAATIGMAVMMVLVYRSLAEHRQRSADPPEGRSGGPGAE
jgi:hypothetical protein